MKVINQAILLILLVLCFGCGEEKIKVTVNKSNPEVLDTNIPAEQINASEEQKERREQSEAICIAKNIPFYKNPSSMFTPNMSDLTLQTKDAIVDRTIALCYIELKSEGAPKKMLKEFDTKYNASEKLSPWEKTFINNDSPSQQDMANANWKAEGVYVFLWSLGYIDSLSFPNEICNVSDIFSYLFKRTEEEFRNDAKLRDKKTIVDEADLILRLDWACVDARVKQIEAPAGMSQSVTYERHYALNWIINLYDEAWDNVSANT